MDAITVVLYAALIGAGAAIAGGSITGLLSLWAVRYMMRQYYSQKWWDKKCEAYSHIIEHLTYLQYYYDEFYTSELERKEMNKYFAKELNSEVIDAYQSIERAAAAGAYIISEDAVKALEELNKELDKDYDTHFERLDSHYGATQKCIRKIRACADIDLKRYIY